MLNFNLAHFSTSVFAIFSKKKVETTGPWCIGHFNSGEAYFEPKKSQFSDLAGLSYIIK
jgi:hypothetical protein